MPPTAALFDDDDRTEEPAAARDFNDQARPPPAQSRKAAPVLDHERELVRVLEKLAYRHDKWRVFSDFCEMAAISLSNAVDRAQAEKREARYMQIVSGYSPEEARQFPVAFNHLMEAQQAEMGDVLGRVFHALELHNKFAGQYFTPDSICRMMAKMTVGDGAELQARIARRGFITAQEPAVGSGAMILALARALHEAGINYQQQLHVVAVDVDPKCLHMAYIQFTLWHIPAVVVLGDTLAMTEREHWYTLAHVLGDWESKLRLERMWERMMAVLTTAEAAPSGSAEVPIIVPRPAVESVPAPVTTAAELPPAQEAEPVPEAIPGAPKLQLTLF